MKGTNAGPSIIYLNHVYICKYKIFVHIFLTKSHPVHQFANHAIPDLRICVSGAVLPVSHNLQLILKPAMLCDLSRQVHAVSLVAFVIREQLCVLL